MAQGYADPTGNGLQPGAQAQLVKFWNWTGLDFNTEQRLWEVALMLALLKTSLDFFHGKT